MQYISVADQKTFESVYRTTVLVVLVFCFTPLLLMGVGKYLGPQGNAIDDPEMLQRLTKLTYGSALVAGLLVVGLRRVWLRVVVGRGGHSVTKLLNSLRVLAILSAALGELVALAGFIAFSLTGSYDFCWRLGVVSLLLILYSFPRRWEWLRLIAEPAAN